MPIVTSFSESLSTAHKRGFALSVTAAFALNGIAIVAFAAAVTRWHVPSAASSPAGWITAVTVVQLLPVPTVAALPTPPRAMAEARPARVTAPPPNLHATAVPKALLLPSDRVSAVRFYRSSEVDQPAEPDSDWNLDTAVLDAVGVERLVFEVFINRNGEVVGCTILEPTALDSQARQNIEDRLWQTALQPAIRAGAAVASVRRIEVSAAPPLQ